MKHFICINCLLKINSEQEAVSRFVPDNYSAFQTLSFIYDLVLYINLQKRRNVQNIEYIVIIMKIPKYLPKKFIQVQTYLFGVMAAWPDPGERRSRRRNLSKAAASI